MPSNIFQRLLTARRLPLLLAAIAVLLVLPSVWTGWQLDDITHRYMLLGHPDYDGKRWSPLEMFSFVRGDSVRTRTMMDLGLAPWWTVEGLRLSFWRPFTALTHWLDYALWSDTAALMHVQGLFWFGALILAVGLLYRQFLGLTWVAGLAALLYAFDDAHGLSAGWIAGRNTVVASLLGVLVLLFHDKWRRGGLRPAAWVAPLFLLVGLLAGEFALGIIAYLIAYALVLDTGSRRERLITLLPYASIALVWMIIYNMLGHGTWGSGFYVDPVSEPFAFAQAFTERAPVLLLDQFGFPPSDLYMLLTSDQLNVLRIWALGFLIVSAIVLYPLVRSDRTARFWTIGLLLALPLICATMPSGRLLSFVGIGAMGLIAQLIAASSARPQWLVESRFRKVLSVSMIAVYSLVHLVIAPLLLPSIAGAATFGEPFLQKAARSLPNDFSMGHKDLIMVNPPIVFFSHYAGALRILDGDQLPRRFRALAPGSTTLHINRSDQQTLVIRPQGGYLAYPFDNVFRGPSQPMLAGEGITLTNMTVTISKVTDDGRPEEAAFEFSAPLEHPSFLWVVWKDGGYIPFEPPPVGATIVLPAVKVF